MSQQVNKIFIGIDVSKDELVTATPHQGGWIQSKVINTLQAIGEWLSSMDIANKHFVLEATGSYSERLIHSLNAAQATFSVVNPSQSRAMSKVLQKTNKNDQQDAKTLSLLGQRMELRVYEMPDKAQKHRKETLAVLNMFQEDLQRIKNRIHAYEYHVDVDPGAMGALKSLKEGIETQITALGNQLEIQCTEKKEIELINRISTIKSVGNITATALVAMFGDFSNFDSAKAFAKFIGLCPSEYSSGSSVRGPRNITKKGSGKVRALIFNCARNAIRFNPNCKKIYDRLIQKGKCGKVALTAVMHKLVRIIYGVINSEQDYNPDYAIAKIKKN